MMKPHWVKMVVCIEAENVAAAREQAQVLTGAHVLAVETLPYPAEPQIGEHSGTPQFCWQPGKCAGKSACPRNPACSE